MTNMGVIYLRYTVIPWGPEFDGLTTGRERFR
jgi:hypothetical protein